jgi:hypothetical protein
MLMNNLLDRAETIMFSKNALVTMRNGCLYLLARVGDIRFTFISVTLKNNLASVSVYSLKSIYIR